MADLCIDDPCILFALSRESAGFRRDFPVTERFPGAPCWAAFCGPSWLPVLVVETGLGADATQTALEWVFSKPKFNQVPYQPKLVLFAGFAGSLVEHLYVGDLVLATEAIDANGNRWPFPWPGELELGDWQPPLKRGTVVSTAHIVTQPLEKRRLAKAHEALAVDMESATFARLCGKRGVPFGVVRAISDDADTALSPHLADLFGGGRLSLRRVLWALFRHPSLVKEFMRLARDTRLASRQLGKGLGELLTLTLPWFDPSSG